MSLTWATLAGLSAEPGLLGRIGPITGSQARQLAEHAARDPAAVWRVIVTGADGHAIGVARIPRRRPPDDSARRDALRAGAGLVGRVTLVISQDTLASRPRKPPSQSEGRPIVAAALRTAAAAAFRAAIRAQADSAAGGCSHQAQSPLPTPAPPLRVRCRQGPDLPVSFLPSASLARRPRPYRPHDHGGRTCRCNLGARCNP